MSLERQGSWKTPPFPEMRQINPLTTNTVPYVNMMTRLYGDFIQRKLQNPVMSFDEYLQQNPVAPVPQAGDYEYALNSLRQRPSVEGPTDTKAAYDAASAAAERNFQTRAMPSILESFGARGGRYGTDVARAIANSYGDVQANLGAAAAKDQIQAQEAYAGRKLTADQTYAQQMAMIGQIAKLFSDIQNTNKQYSYADYLKNQPETYLQGARSMLDIQPIFPQTVIGPTGFYQEKPNIWDYIGRIQQHVGNDASIIGSFMGGFASSRKFKEAERDVTDLELEMLAQEMLTTPIKEWKYRPEYSNVDKMRIGPMLEDMPEATRENENQVDEVSYMGAMLATIQVLSKRIEMLEAKLEQSYAVGGA